MTNDSEIWLVGHGRAVAFDDSVTVCCLIWTHFSQHFCKALGVQHRAVGGTFASIIYYIIYICVYIYINIVYTYAHVFVRILHTTMFNNKSIHVPQLDQTCWIIHLKSMLNCWRDVESDTIWRNVHRVQGVLSFFWHQVRFQYVAWVCRTNVCVFLQYVAWVCRTNVCVFLPTEDYLRLQGYSVQETETLVALSVWVLRMGIELHSVLAALWKHFGSACGHVGLGLGNQIRFYVFTPRLPQQHLRGCCCIRRRSEVTAPRFAA